MDSPGPIPDAKYVDRSVACGGRNHVCVMLHLRPLYDSKAAILTNPVPQASVENRSPA